MNNFEVQFIISQMQETYNGEPWFGRPVVQILPSIDTKTAYHQPEGGHSILELLWHDHLEGVYY